MAFDHGVHQRKAQAHSRNVGVGQVMKAREGFEQSVLLSGVDAWAFVANADDPVGASRAQAALHRTLGGTVFDGVVEHVGPGPAPPRGGRPDRVLSQEFGR